MNGTYDKRALDVTWVRFPLLVKWYTTNRCNLKCKHYYLTDYTKQAPFEKALSLVDYFAAKKIHSINFLGGEPLEREDLEIIIS